MPRSYKISNSGQGYESESVASDPLRGTSSDDCQRINPDVSHQHAVAAANTALNTSVDGLVQDQTRTSADMPRGLRKTQSVRFTGPNANQKAHRSITRRVAPTWDHITSGIRRSPPKSPHAQSIFPHDVRNKIISKSSYRKIKKSRSMLSPRKSFMTPTSVNEPHLQRRKSHLSGSTACVWSSPDKGVVRADKALMQLPNPHQTTYDQDRAIKIAQQEYRRQIEGLQAFHSLSHAQSDGSSPSTLKTARKKPSKLFKRSVRTTNGNQYGASVSSEPVTDSHLKDKTVGKARKTSSSLRTRILKILGIKSSKTLPTQQVESDRLHWSNLSTEESENVLRGIPLIPSPDDDLILRARSRTYNDSPIQDNNSRASSIRHVLNEEPEHDGSRATSWAYSTTTNDTNSSMALNERKRLTVIDEDCDAYQPSTSTNVGQMTSRSRYDAFRRPLKPGRINEPVDSQDMYMALQHRFSNSKIGHNDQPASHKSESSLRASLVRRMASQESHATTNTEKASNSNNAKEGVLTGCTQEIIDREPLGAVEDVFAPERKASSTFSSLKAKASIRRLSKEKSKASIRKLSKEKSKEKSSRKIRNTLRKSSSSIVPGQNSKETSESNPHKVAMRSSSKHKTKLGNIIQRSHKRSQSPGPNAGDEDSVYSRHITGTPSDIGNHLASSESILNLGNANVRDSQTMAKHYSDLISEHSSDGRVTSGASTLDWRSWAAQQVAGLADLSKKKSEAFHEDSNARSWTAENIDAHSQDTDAIPTPRRLKLNQTDGTYDFDYGFATSNVLRGQHRQASEVSVKGVDSTLSYHNYSEISGQDDLPLTERKFSQSNLPHIHSREQFRESLPSYRHQSGENQRNASSRAFQFISSSPTPPPMSVTKDYNVPEHSPNWHSINKTSFLNEQNLGSQGLNIQTVVVRRNRRERAERLRRIKSSKALVSYSEDENSVNNESKHYSQAPNSSIGERELRTPDIPYENPGTNMLGPRLSYGKRNRSIKVLANREDELEPQHSPVFM